MPNTTVPAADAGLPSLIRRSALGEAGGAIFEPSVFTLGEQRLIKRAMALVEGKRLRGGPILDSYDVLERYLVLRLAGLTNEQFHVLYLDVSCRLLEARTEFFGRQGHVKVDIRQIALHAIVLGAEYVVFVHNHPSGTPSPSEDELQFVTQSEAALQSLGIDLLDSFVVTSRGVTSINDVRRRNKEERDHRVQVELARLKMKRRLKREAKKANGQPLPEPKSSPMIAQYLEIKAAHSDALLFYRMGDFYELFFQDAEIAAKALGIVLTRRGKHAGEGIPMCGVPMERAEDYLHRLIGLGHRVAVCEQVEDVAEARKHGELVRRVVRLVTPGGSENCSGLDWFAGNPASRSIQA